MGLLAKANAILEQEQKAAIEAAETKEDLFAAIATGEAVECGTVKDESPKYHFGLKPSSLTAQQPVKPKRFKKLKKLVAAFALGLAVTQTPTNVGHFNNQPTKLEVKTITAAEETAAMKQLDEFTHLRGGVTNHERDMLAQMLYGEAGLGADPFEVLHTVLNRKASPLFKGTIEDLVSQPGQYIGYRASNPVTPAFRRMVDLAIADWEKGDKKAIDGCNHYYFVTGIPNNCNKFEISHDQQGKWVAPRHKHYEKLRHYCPVAEQQAAKFYAEYGHGNPREM